MHFYAALEEKESNQQGGLVAYLLWPEQRKGWPFCLPEQLVNSDSRDEERQCQAPRAGTMECRHAIDQGGGCWQSGAVGWKGHGLPSAEEATKDSPCLVLLHFLFCFIPWRAGRRFCGFLCPTELSLFPLPPGAALEVPGSVGMERCSPSYCPHGPGSMFCRRKHSHPSLWAFCVLFSLPKVSIWNNNSLNFIFEVGAFLISH